MSFRFETVSHALVVVARESRQHCATNAAATPDRAASCARHPTLPIRRERHSVARGRPGMLVHCVNCVCVFSVCLLFVFLYIILCALCKLCLCVLCVFAVCSFCIFVCSLHMFLCSLRMFVCSLRMFVCSLRMFVCSLSDRVYPIGRLLALAIRRFRLDVNDIQSLVDAPV